MVDINFEEVKKQIKNIQIQESFDIDSEDKDRLIAAIGAGFGCELYKNAIILSKVQESIEVNEFGENIINEAKALVKTVVRKGKLTKRTICPEGFMVKNNICQRMTSKDIIAFTRRAKKAAKTRARRKPTSLSKRMRARSLLVRNKNEAKVNRIVAATPNNAIK